MDRFKKNELRRDALERVRGEIAQEKAAALARITRALERHLARLERLERELRQTEPGLRGNRLSAYEAARHQAERYRWYLRIQREVNGLVDGDDLEARYRIPGPMAD